MVQFYVLVTFHFKIYSIPQCDSNFKPPLELNRVYIHVTELLQPRMYDCACLKNICVNSNDNTVLTLTPIILRNIYLFYLNISNRIIFIL